MHLNRLVVPLASMAFFVTQLPAFASAGFSCEAADKNVARLLVEGATPRSGDGLINFGGVIEIEAGKRIEFGKTDVRKFVWNRNLWIEIRKKLDRRDFLEIKVRTHMKEEEEPFPGAYTVRSGKARISGKLNCAAE